MGQILIGCSGWNYSDSPDKVGWTGVFYPDKDTKRLRYYSQFFNTVEMDSSLYEKFYSQMTKGTFIGMVRGTPKRFQFSVKDPETITHGIGTCTNVHDLKSTTCVRMYFH
jgi:uncharacterized protein YecE (DUF72 family)